MISINNICVSFSGIPLFSDISFVINPRDRIGLTGKNGAGKSTLLKIIYGEQEADSGTVSFPNDMKMGYLPQQMIYPEGKTVFNEAMTAFEESENLKKQIEKLNLELSERTDYESATYLKIIHRLTEAQDRYQLTGGASAPAETEKILKGLGFENKDFDRTVETFSGGWRMRIELAKILLRRPNVFLLDEPTNHLDIESIQWLEDFLKDYPGAVLMISHDRTFLDNITKRTLEISAGKIYDYKAAFSEYEILRKERREQQTAAYENQQKMIQDTEKFIERFRYQATKAVQVQSRVKQLDKVVRLEIDEEDFSNLNFRFPPAPRSGTIVFEAANLTKRYDKEPILEDIFLTVERGEKVAFIGKNGEGKTTLVRVVKGELPFEGELKIGHNVKIGYYAQNQNEYLDEKKTVFQTLDDIAKGDVRTKVRDILGQFLFSGEDIDKKVAVLSGGERARLALAKLMLEPYNLLILDEPTNHLDMRSKDILKQALMKYDGTLVLVSHDRSFLQDLAEKLYEFANRKIKQHSGDIQLFLQKKKLENLKDIEQKKQEKSFNKSENENQTGDSKDIYLRRKEIDKQIRKVQKQLEQTESDIDRLESFIKKSEHTLACGIEIKDQKFYDEFDNAKSELAEKMKEWEKLSVEITDLEIEKNKFF
jgi:ATP-binding cassette subfamily F protein 3